MATFLVHVNIEDTDNTDFAALAQHVGSASEDPAEILTAWVEGCLSIDADGPAADLVPEVVLAEQI